MIRRPPRSTLDRSSAASDVYKRQELETSEAELREQLASAKSKLLAARLKRVPPLLDDKVVCAWNGLMTVSYTHLRAHETVLDLVCRLLLEKKKKKNQNCIILRYIE